MWLFYKEFAGSNPLYGAEFVSNGNGTWNTTPTLTAAFGSDHSFSACGTAISTDAGVLIARGHNSGGMTCSVYLKPRGAVTFTRVVRYVSYWTGAATSGFASSGSPQVKLLDLGNNRVLLLFGNVGQIFWALSTDGGITFPRGVSGGGTINSGILGYTAEAGGCMIGTMATPYATANVDMSTNFSSWDAAYNANTKKVGLIYSGIRAAGTGNQPAGIKYAEFDAAAFTWTAQANHVILSHHRNGGGTTIGESAGMYLCASDGVFRAFWLAQMYDASYGSNATFVRGIAYCRVKPLGDPAVSTDWYNVREFIVPFFGRTAAAYAGQSNAGEFCGSPQGILAVGGVNCVPVCYTIGTDETSNGGATFDVLMKLVPIAAIDAFP